MSPALTIDANQILDTGNGPVDVFWNQDDWIPPNGEIPLGDHWPRRTLTGSFFDPDVSVFKCTDCNAFCYPHKHGAAVLDGDWFCDDCLIERART
jgi:hypothetical protein